MNFWKIVFFEKKLEKKIIDLKNIQIKQYGLIIRCRIFFRVDWLQHFLKFRKTNRVMIFSKIGFFKVPKKKSLNSETSKTKILAKPFYAELNSASIDTATFANFEKLEKFSYSEKIPY